MSYISVRGLKVIFSRDAVADFRSVFPASNLRDRAYWFEFDKHRDLIDTDVPQQDDGTGALALSQDAEKYLFEGKTPSWARIRENPRKLRISRRGEKIGEFRMAKVSGRDPRKVKRIIRRLHGRGVRVNPSGYRKKDYKTKRYVKAIFTSNKPMLGGVLRHESVWFPSFDAAKDWAFTIRASNLEARPDLVLKLEFVGSDNPPKNQRLEVHDLPIFKAFTMKKNPVTTKQVFVQAQSGDSWKTVALVKDTPELRTLAKRFAKTYKRKHPSTVIRVISE